ncbi:TldD/PmbA family protein [Tepidimicrobium xylanilyticum]|uniref:PmbA protein n=1 Tax=Tepidimicrobium xylanilyticum TaxID=1123352 RepID=A0A1H3B839_9FIRM|nr:TldD/PmbA family protein [Tepidimicrobium xylanilyticum]GMG96971.1 peptidase [Tepidimicrobium xylanilyticum]SDX38180.1 PmbA protein [Tepidimicrobium xylanilyticum]
MKYKGLVDKIFEKGKSKFEDMEVYIENNKEIEIAVFKGEIDRYNISETEGLSFRGINNGKLGYSYTEKVDESSIDMLIEEAYENGKYIDAQDREIIFEGSDKYKDLDGFNLSLKETPLEDKIEFIKALEKEAFELDSRIVAVSYCIYKEMESSKYLYNTKGLNLSNNVNLAVAYIMVVAKEGEETKTGLSYRIAKDFSCLDYKGMAQEAVEEALSYLGAKSIKSNEYSAVLKNTVFADILSAFKSIFFADYVQKGLSLLKDKVGKQVAVSNFTLVDDPFNEDGLVINTFDDEGTATKFNKIIENGILRTYLYNWRSALKDGVESTGNGYRTSYKSPISTSTSNLYVGKGDKSLEEILKTMDRGLLITDVQGLHSGLDPVSGDYSLSALGYEIENGRIKRPVNQITIAGNIFETLMDIEEIGNDLRFSMDGVGSPSIKVKKLAVAGE